MIATAKRSRNGRPVWGVLSGGINVLYGLTRGSFNCPGYRQKDWVGEYDRQRHQKQRTAGICFEVESGSLTTVCLLCQSTAAVNVTFCRTRA
jgi:hypothetical protein